MKILPGVSKEGVLEVAVEEGLVVPLAVAQAENIRHFKVQVKIHLALLFLFRQGSMLVAALERPLLRRGLCQLGGGSS